MGWQEPRQKHGASNVLVTLGRAGSVLVRRDGASLARGALVLPSGYTVVDETRAGDCYRAAFAVALTGSAGGGDGDGDGDGRGCAWSLRAPPERWR